MFGYHKCDMRFINLSIVSHFTDEIFKIAFCHWQNQVVATYRSQKKILIPVYWHRGKQ